MRLNNEQKKRLLKVFDISAMVIAAVFAVGLMSVVMNELTLILTAFVGTLCVLARFMIWRHQRKTRDHGLTQD